MALENNAMNYLEEVSIQKALPLTSREKILGIGARRPGLTGCITRLGSTFFFPIDIRGREIFFVSVWEKG